MVQNIRKPKQIKGTHRNCAKSSCWVGKSRSLFVWTCSYSALTIPSHKQEARIGWGSGEARRRSRTERRAFGGCKESTSSQVAIQDTPQKIEECPEHELVNHGVSIDTSTDQEKIPRRQGNASKSRQAAAIVKCSEHMRIKATSKHKSGPAARAGTHQQHSHAVLCHRRHQAQTTCCQMEAQSVNMQRENKKSPIEIRSKTRIGGTECARSANCWYQRVTTHPDSLHIVRNTVCRDSFVVCGFEDIILARPGRYRC
jgi:hypothetical protein